MKRPLNLRAGDDQQIAKELIVNVPLHHLGRCEPAHGISRYKLRDNPFWTEQTQAPHGERYVVLAPLALSRTQDDKGRVRWTLFGASEQGPAKAFWRGFYTEPGRWQWTGSEQARGISCAGCWVCRRMVRSRKNFPICGVPASVSWPTTANRCCPIGK